MLKLSEYHDLRCEDMTKYAKHALIHKYTNITTKIKYTKVFWVWIGFAETDTQAWNSPARAFLLLLGHLKIWMSENVTLAKMGLPDLPKSPMVTARCQALTAQDMVRQNDIVRGAEVLSSEILTGCLEKASLPWRSASPECTLGSTPERPRKSRNTFLLSEWSIQSAGQKKKRAE